MGARGMIGLAKLGGENMAYMGARGISRGITRVKSLGVVGQKLTGRTSRVGGFGEGNPSTAPQVERDRMAPNKTFGTSSPA